MHNSPCYQFVHYKDMFAGMETVHPPLFDSILDATYILHLEGNGRLLDIRKQLVQNLTSSNVFVVVNKGYKKCKKPDWVNITCRDLIHFNFEIFKHAKEAHYENILILEDDFFFDERIHNNKVKNDIITFVKRMSSHDKFVYTMGCLPILIMPVTVDLLHYNGFFTATHNILCNRKYRENVLKNYDPALIRDWDEFVMTTYMYHEPVCYQLFPKTENRENWAREFWFYPVYIAIISKLIFWVELDKKTDYYHNIYNLVKMLFYIFFVTALFILSLMFLLLFIFYNDTTKR